LKTLNKTSADDEEFPMEVILQSNGLEDAIWCLRAEPEHKKAWGMYAVWCARQVQYLMCDKRSIDALDVSEKFWEGGASKEELGIARGNAADAATSAAAADAAATAAAATSAAYAAYAASISASTAAADAADAAATAAADAAYAAADARQEMKKHQKIELSRVFSL
jgi:hypothetical protein